MKCHSLAILYVVLALCVSGCVHSSSFSKAEEALKNKDWDVAVAEYSAALKKEPNNPEIKLKLNMAKIFASRTHYEQAKRLLEKKNLQDAVIHLELATNLDPENKSAAELLLKVQQQIQHPTAAAAVQPPPERPLSELPSIALQPVFAPKSNVPIELKFKDTSLKEVLQTLGKLGDVNILFDKDFHDMPVSFDFNDTTFLQALDTVLTSTQNFYKVIGKNTITVAPDNPQKRAEYEESVSRTFYLSNADVEEIARVLRNVLGIQMIATNTRLNTVTIKDRITRVIAAEKIVNQLDKGKPEVVVDVEILEVNRDRLQDYGLQIHSPGGDAIETNLIEEPKRLRLDPGPILTRSNFFITNFPNATLKLLEQDSNSRLLASLPLRTVVGETGRVRFGSQVPVPQTTFAPIATGGVNQQPITSFIYRDVGINIDITPRVHYNGEVTMEVIIESSSISGTGFANLPQFSTSRVEKTIRLKEGETNIIAGLIRDEERTSLRGLPFLSKVPILGKIFAANEKEVKETDVVLALSPHIIRNLEITPEDQKMLWLGIEGQQQGGGIYHPFINPVPAVEEQPEEEKPAKPPTKPNGISIEEQKQPQTDEDQQDEQDEEQPDVQ
jgi:general secretion pathway protein D